MKCLDCFLYPKQNHNVFYISWGLLKSRPLRFYLSLEEGMLSVNKENKGRKI